MKINKIELPTPTTEEVKHSQRLKNLIAAEIKQKGPISFQHFMQMALYQPKWGYYTGGRQQFGKEGDFVTAPEISPLFSFCVARQCQQVLASIDNSSILELGAGSGRMALNILRELDRLNCLPQHYYILEVSAALRSRQRALITQEGNKYISRIIWLDSLPSNLFSGVIVANEVIDAMPIHRFKVDDEIQEFFVDVVNNEFIWKLQPINNTRLKSAIENLKIAPPYISEINLILKPWVKTLDESLKQGLMLLIDYGFTRQEYYHPQRSMGTLLCHYRHRAHDDPLILTGIQDITANVDFTAVAEACDQAGMQVAGFTHQAGFLLNCGLTHYLNEAEPNQFELNQQIKRLTLPSEMGERFKVIALSKQYNEELMGFQQFDQLERL